ncbi:dihydrofolate reductase family protein [Mesorhizobium sp. M0601]|uniref:dihydrofolate reductase family protein n=1 Tax=unclassified Mesorhizobium TaxID=325217 RepID=UPI0033355B1E
MGAVTERPVSGLGKSNQSACTGCCLSRNQPAKLQPGGESWAEAYVASGDLAEEVAKLKAQEGKPIIAHGGVSFARSLVAQGLVDQLALMVAPWRWAKACRCSPNSPRRCLSSW